ncbi:hypothetical protein SDC9_200232 [bioreactor metagenome]|uniref:Uncharacterized protein n=1 Tax=bioreactor metagenome TaxID=1076179 RepID=A0A645IN94_9ZZZZ
MDLYSGDYWSLLIDIPSLIGDGISIAVPLIPGGIGTLKAPLRTTKSIKTFDKIKDLIKTGTQLDWFAKKFLRREARDFLLKNSDDFAKAIAKGTKLDVHHIIPLEWAHVMGKGFDPNMLDNLAGVDPTIHKKINQLWNEFRNDWKEISPTIDDIYKKTKEINDKFGDYFVR